MQLDAREHFIEIVEAAIADYEAAEVELTHAAQPGDERAIRWASLRAPPWRVRRSLLASLRGHRGSPPTRRTSLLRRASARGPRMDCHKRG
jgi:hypothetical protein